MPNFKSNAAYRKWLAYGHASGEFAKTPGNQPVKIKGKKKKVKHKYGGYLPEFNLGGTAKQTDMSELMSEEEDYFMEMMRGGGYLPMYQRGGNNTGAFRNASLLGDSPFTEQVGSYSSGQGLGDLRSASDMMPDSGFGSGKGMQGTLTPEGQKGSLMPKGDGEGFQMSGDAMRAISGATMGVGNLISGATGSQRREQGTAEGVADVIQNTAASIFPIAGLFHAASEGLQSAIGTESPGGMTMSYFLEPHRLLTDAIDQTGVYSPEVAKEDQRKAEAIRAGRLGDTSGVGAQQVERSEEMEKLLANPQIGYTPMSQRLTAQKPYFGATRGDLWGKSFTRKHGGMTPGMYEAEGGEVMYGAMPNVYSGGSASQITDGVTKLNGRKHEGGGMIQRGGEKVLSDSLYLADPSKYDL
jgi:hypothetical protein